jgi:hypothetical protein
VEGRNWPSRWAGQRGARWVVDFVDLFFTSRYLRDRRSDGQGSLTKDETECSGGGIQNIFILFK